MLESFSVLEFIQAVSCACAYQQLSRPKNSVHYHPNKISWEYKQPNNHRTFDMLQPPAGSLLDVDI